MACRLHGCETAKEVLLSTPPVGVSSPSFSPWTQTSASNCQTCPSGFDFPGCHGNVTTQNSASTRDTCSHSLSGGHLSHTGIGCTAERPSHVKKNLGPQRLTVHGACWECKLIPLGRVPIGSVPHPATRVFPSAIQIQFASPMLWTCQERTEMHQEENTTASGEDGTETYGLRVTERPPQTQGSVTSFANKANG